MLFADFPNLERRYYPQMIQHDEILTTSNRFFYFVTGFAIGGGAAAT